MPTQTEPFVLSIETDAGTYVHGFHLGTLRPLAEQIAKEAFHAWTPKQGKVIKTVAIMRNGRVVATYNGDGRGWV